MHHRFRDTSDSYEVTNAGNRLAMGPYLAAGIFISMLWGEKNDIGIFDTRRLLKKCVII